MAEALDVTGSKGVEVRVSADRKVIWINTREGGCILRICRIEALEIVQEGPRGRRGTLRHRAIIEGS